MTESRIYEIKNEYLSLKVNSFGGTIDSLTLLDKNKELIYQIEEGGWQNKDVVIFPFISKGDFIHKNIHYLVKANHGLIRNALLSISKHDKDEIIFEYSSKEIDLEQYPFKFIFFLSYKLIDKRVEISAKIVNQSDETMYFSFGHHPAFKIDLDNSYLEGIDNYFPLTDEGLLDCETKLQLNKEKLPLNKESILPFKTLIVDNYTKNNGIKNYILETGLGYKVNYRMPSTFIAVWSSDKGNFICVEPRFGVTNIVNEERELKNRKFYNSLSPEEETSFTYSFEIIEE